MHVNSGYEHEAGGLLARFERVFARLRRGRLAVGVLCRARARANPGRARSSVRVDRVPGRPAGRGRRGRVVPAPGDAAPDVPLAAAAGASATGRGGCCEAVRGIDLVELEGERECCGFGGTFAVKNADTSMAMLSDKVRHVLDTRAEVCTSADTSCLMHIGGALSRGSAPACARCTSRRSWRRRNELPERARRSRWPTPSCAATSARRRR